MYLQNKYTNIYYSIIYRSKSRNLDSSTYVEKHHIIPQSIGGTNNPKNIVTLTAREHFICHWLLTKMTVGEQQNKMIYALRGMQRKNRNQQRYETKTTAKVYEKIRILAAERFSLRTVSDETRRKISISKRGQSHPQTEETKAKIGLAHRGTKKPPLSEQHKQRISEVQKGSKKPPCSDERKAKISRALSGRKQGPMSEDSKKKLSESKKGKKLFVDPVTGKRYMAFPTTHV